MSEYKILRFSSKSNNRPPSKTHIRQIDIGFEFPEIAGNGPVFYIPRLNNVINEIDDQHGHPIDFGIDWSRAKLTLEGPIFDASFFDELLAHNEYQNNAYFRELKRDYYVYSSKGQRWKVSLNNDWAARYIERVSGAQNTDLKHDILKEFDSVLSARFLYVAGSIYRVWSQDNNIYVSSDNGWENSISIGTGIRPSISSNIDASDIIVAWEKDGVLYHNRRIHSEWLGEKPLFPETNPFSMGSTYINPSDGIGLGFSQPIYDTGATYHHPFALYVNNMHWVYYVKRVNKENTINYRIDTQLFRFENNVPVGIDGDKTDVFAYLTDENKILLTWINRYNGVSNVFFIFSAPIKNDSSGNKGNWNQYEPRESLSINPKEKLEFELIKV